MSRRAAQKNARWPKVLAWTSGIFLVLLLGAYFAAQAWLNRYLRSSEFREKLEERAGINMRAKVEIAPVRFEGAQFFCDSFLAQGVEEADFSQVKVDSIRGDVNLPSIIKVIFGHREFGVDNVEIQKVGLDFYRNRLSDILPPREPHEHKSHIANLTIRDMTVGWPTGGIKGATVRASTVDGGWKIEGSNGRVTQLGLPPIDLASLRATFKEPSLFIQDARLTHNGGELNVSGEVTNDDKADLLFVLRDLNLTPLLPEDWRARLHGKLGGDVRFVMPLRDGKPEAPTVSGKLELRDGKLEALPILAKIAEFTKTDRFRHIPLNTLTADFSYDATGLRITNLVLESKQLIVLRGGFTVANEMVDGTFDIGITPGPLQWLPGSQEKVFNANNGGYAWTKMRVTGPLNALQEDLTPRLVAAAEAAAVEKVQGTAVEAVDTARKAGGTAIDAAKKAADVILTPLFGN